jgi:uncharacterized protein YcbK (DUF882 family)
MGNLSPHISRHEVACKCGCGMCGADKELIAVIEDCVAHFELRQKKRLPVHFNSWCRCWEHNKDVGGLPDSYHPKAIAVDFWIKSIPDDSVADYLEAKYPNKYGIGRYKGRTHLDVRKLKARWAVDTF